MGVSPKNRGKCLRPKIDGENNGTPYEQMDALGGNTPIFGSTHILNKIIYLGGQPPSPSDK